VQEMAMEVERKCSDQGSDETFQKLCRRLNVNAETDSTESFVMTVKRAMDKCLKDTATNISFLLQKLEGFVNTGILCIFWPSELMMWCSVHCPVSVCQLFHLKVFYSRTAQQN